MNVKELLSLKNKVCLITGGEGKYGRCITEELAEAEIGRMANNDDIKGVVVFLASQAIAYINGENILMDGGMHA
jgi:NAD(P)-dependent dehydrogenase (short-subunit alcohol dehydrogenase family)